MMVGEQAAPRGWPHAATAAAPFTLALLGPLLPLLIIFAGTLPATAPQGSKTLALAVGAILFVTTSVSIAGLWAGGFRDFPKPLAVALAAVIIAECIAALLGVNPAASFFGIANALAGIVWLVASAQVLSDLRLRRAFLACYFISAAAAAVFAMGLSIMRQPPAMFAYEHGRASGTFLQPNEFAGYLLFVIPLGLAQIAAPRWLRIIGLAGAFLGTAGLVLSVSRAAMLSLICGLWILVRRFGKPALVAYFLIAALVLIAMATTFRDVAHDPSENASRIAVWSGSIRLAQRVALTGVGRYGFHAVYPAFKRPEVAVNEVHAHNVPLQILIEDGILGFAALIWVALAAIKQGFRVGVSIPASDRERTLLFAALVAGFAASALQNLVDVVTTFLLVAFWPMMGLLLALSRQERTAPWTSG